MFPISRSFRSLRVGCRCCDRQWRRANEVLVLEDLVYLGRQSTFVFANPYLISGENERKAMESLQTVSLQNFSCIEVMEGMISVIRFLVCSFVLPSERASDRLERILPIWRQNLIWIFILYFTFRDVRDPVASSDRSFQVSTSQDLGKPIGWQTVYIDVYIDAYILCAYLSNTLNRYIYSSNVLLSFFFFHFSITRNDEV